MKSRLKHPPEALSLHQELLAESPYLSDTVMKSAIAKEEVLPNAMIRDILVANPQSAKTEDVLETLNERFIPMPDIMMEEIMEGTSILSAKEELQSEITDHAIKRKKAFNQLMRRYKNDTIGISQQDSIIWLLQQETSLTSRYKMAFEYLNSGDTTMTNEILDSIPVSFSLTSALLNQHVDYQAFFNLLKNLQSNSKSILEIDSTQTEILVDLVATSTEPVRSYARTILITNGLCEYHEPILLPDLSNPPPSKPTAKPDPGTSDEYFKLYPNPAKHFVILEYNLQNKFGETSKNSFVVYDVSGKKVEIIPIDKQQDQLTLAIETYPSGIYFCCLSVGGEVVQIIRFTILK